MKKIILIPIFLLIINSVIADDLRILIAGSNELILAPFISDEINILGIIPEKETTSVEVDELSPESPIFSDDEIINLTAITAVKEKITAKIKKNYVIFLSAITMLVISMLIIILIIAQEEEKKKKQESPKEITDSKTKEEDIFS